MDAVAQGTNLASMQFALEEHFNAGDKVSMVVGFNDPFNKQDANDFTQYMKSCGLEVTSPAQVIAGPYPYNIAFQIRRPVIASSDKVSFWPMLLLGLGGVAAAGWILYKGSQMADTFTSSLSRAIIPLALIGVGGFIVYKVVTAPKGSK